MDEQPQENRRGCGSQSAYLDLTEVKMYCNTVLRLCRYQRSAQFLYSFRAASNYYQDRYRHKFFIEETQIEKAFPIPEYELIYTYSHMRVLQFFQTYNRTISVAATFFTASLSNEMLQTVMVEYSLLPFCIFAAVATNVVAYLIRNTIGCIYYNKKEDKVLISYLTHWAMRKNVIVENKDVVEITQSLGVWCPMIFRYLDILSPELSLKLNIRRINIFDRSKFLYITGLPL